MTLAITMSTNKAVPAVPGDFGFVANWTASGGTPPYTYRYVYSLKGDWSDTVILLDYTDTPVTSFSTTLPLGDHFNCQLAVRVNDAAGGSVAAILPYPVSTSKSSVQTVQWLLSELEAANTDTALAEGPGFSWISEFVPYRVPPNAWLAISDVQVSSKFNQGASDSTTSGGGTSPRDSYLVIENVLAVPSSVSFFSPRIPILVPRWTLLDVHFINNAVEQQWMNAAITGYLLPFVPGQDYRDVLKANGIV